MLINNLKISSIEPNEIKLTWENPIDSNFAEIVIVKKIKEYSIDITDGIAISAGKSTVYKDTNVVPMEIYYYTIYCKDNALTPNYYSSTLTRGYCLCTKDWQLSEYAYNSFPSLYREYDINGDLKDYINVITGLFNSIFSNLTYLKYIHNIDYVDEFILDKLGKSFGYKLNDDFSINFRRRELKNILKLYQLKGTKLGLDYLIEEISQWNYFIKEMFDNIFYISNPNCKISNINNLNKGFYQDTSRYIYGDAYRYNNIQIFIESNLDEKQKLIELTINKIKDILKWWLPATRTGDLIEIKLLYEKPLFNFTEKIISDMTIEDTFYFDYWKPRLKDNSLIINKKSHLISNNNYKIASFSDNIIKDFYYDRIATYRDWVGISDLNYLTNNFIIGQKSHYEYSINLDAIKYEQSKSIDDIGTFNFVEKIFIDSDLQLSDTWNSRDNYLIIGKGLISNNNYKIASYKDIIIDNYKVNVIGNRLIGINKNNYLINSFIINQPLYEEYSSEILM